MTWRLRVEHRTHHTYAGPVLASYNEARITPTGSTRQFVIDHRVDVHPRCSVLRYVDYWGTPVCAFDVHEPHTDLIVSGHSIVETRVAPEIEHEAGWDELRSAAVRDRFFELLAPSPFVPADDQFSDTARELVEGLSPIEAVDAIAAWTRSTLAYERGSTNVQTKASEALTLHRGVCQDFVHVALGVLRAAGVPARYASGYLHPHEDAVVDELALGEGHAWLDAWVGSWVSVDPTSGSRVAERHVLAARGRDYGDVPPFKGVFHGPPSENVDVRVAITRVA